MLIGGGMVASASAADDASPKVSTFAPAKDLAGQVDQYLKELDKAVTDEDSYKEAADGKIVRDANTLIVLALALGLHDEESKYKASAGALIKASQELAATKDFDSAKKAVAGLKAAAKNNAAADLKWEKIASLSELMKQVPVINTKLKMKLAGAKFKSKAKETTGYTAVIATIAHASSFDTSVTKNDDEVKQWHKFSTDTRDFAGQLNAAIHQGDKSAADKAMKKLAQSCDD
jgi:hypothetical protein